VVTGEALFSVHALGLKWEFENLCMPDEGRETETLLIMNFYQPIICRYVMDFY